ncbi:MAG: hypothetical protein KGH60_00650 [Candidatus Micrarchaeota archaeon]|nr:hypothetical protein [Candidatus Micrarchaeota archaeon]
MAFRENVALHLEIRDIIIADLVLIVAFSLAASGGVLFGGRVPGTWLQTFVFVLPIAAVGVTLNFVLHELMHRTMARHYGAIAGFRTSLPGLFVTLITGAFGFLLGIPGATMIYASRFSLKEHGIVSLAGPLTNLAIFLIFIVVSSALGVMPGYSANGSLSNLEFAVQFIIFISLWLAFFNMLPIGPLDGHAVFTWNKPVYLATMAAVFLLLIFFTALSVWSLVYVLIIALIMSQFMRFTVR